MTHAISIHASGVLRHAPPFRFVNDCMRNSETRLTAKVPALPPAAAWAARLRQSVLPVEYAAQAMGVLIRHRFQTPGMMGSLAGVSEFCWYCAPAPLSAVIVDHTGSRGQFTNSMRNSLALKAMHVERRPA